MCVSGSVCGRDWGAPEDKISNVPQVQPFLLFEIGSLISLVTGQVRLGWPANEL